MGAGSAPVELEVGEGAGGSGGLIPVIAGEQAGGGTGRAEGRAG